MNKQEQNRIKRNVAFKNFLNILDQKGIYNNSCLTGKKWEKLGLPASKKNSLSNWYNREEIPLRHLSNLEKLLELEQGALLQGYKDNLSTQSPNTVVTSKNSSQLDIAFEKAPDYIRKTICELLKIPFTIIGIFSLKGWFTKTAVAAVIVISLGAYYAYQAKKNFDDEKYDQALTLYDLAIKEDPHNKYSYSHRGFIHVIFGNYGKAILDLTTILILEPDNEEALINRAGLYLNMHKWEKAFNDLEHVLLINPHNHSVLNCLGVYYQHAKKDYKKALAYYNEALKLLPQEEYIFMNKGHLLMAHFKNESWAQEEALKAFEQALKITPDNMEILTLTGSLLMLQKKYSLGIEVLAKVLESEQTSPKDRIIALENRANAYYLTQKFDNALQDCSNLLKIKSNSSLAYGIMSNISFKKKDYDIAIKYSQKSLEIDPKNQELLKNYYAILVESGIFYLQKKDYDNARKNAEQALKINSNNNEDALNLRGVVFLKKNKLSEALTDFHNVLKINPKRKEAWGNIGDCYFKQNNKDEAIKNYKKALEIDPKYEYVAQKMNWILNNNYQRYQIHQGLLDLYLVQFKNIKNTNTTSLRLVDKDELAQIKNEQEIIIKKIDKIISYPYSELYPGINEEIISLNVKTGEKTETITFPLLIEKK